MQAPVSRLYPSALELPLQGLYLRHDVRSLAHGEGAFVYTNYIASLDGRISESDPRTGRRRVPAALANARDWRLYMELLAQSDVVLTTARHLRAIASGRQAEFLDLSDPQYADLGQWRAERGLTPYPAIGVLSNRLDFPSQVKDRLPGGLLVMTSGSADPRRVAALRNDGIDLIQTRGDVRGRDLVEGFAEKGLRHIYSVAGPGIMHTLVSAHVLDRIYLSLAPMILAGEPYDTLARGPALHPAAGFRLHELYLDPAAPAAGGQLLMSFDRTE